MTAAIDPSRILKKGGREGVRARRSLADAGAYEAANWSRLVTTERTGGRFGVGGRPPIGFTATIHSMSVDNLKSLGPSVTPDVVVASLRA